MKKEKNYVEYELSDGVTIGETRNPVAYSPKYGSLIVDENTHHFLLQISRGIDIRVDTSDYETQKSMLLLMQYEVIKKCNIEESDELNHPIITYKPTLTDLVIKKDLLYLTKLLYNIARIVAKWLNIPFLSLGLMLYAVFMIFWLFFSSTNNVVLVWITQPILLIVSIISVSLVSILFHEAGHYAGALICGIKPNAGVGLYYNSLAAYVDLTPLDTKSKKDRIIADVAGISIDGYSLTILTLIALLFRNDFFNAITVGMAMRCLASFSLSEKSDFYWVLRDLLDGRSVTATWATPKLLFQSLKYEKKGRKFLIVLTISYAVIILTSLAIFSRWLYSAYNVAVKISIPDLLPAIISFLLFTIVFIIIFLIRKSYANIT